MEGSQANFSPLSSCSRYIQYKMIKYKVNIRCNTYNHGKYIVSALDGFTRQSTNFPFIAIIVDDASTDDNERVIKEYFESNFHQIDDPDWPSETSSAFSYIGRHNTNHNCYFLLYFLKYNHYKIGKRKAQYFSKLESSTEYSAFCEGDDYWLDPEKLQKQVNYLDTHPEYSMCFHAVKECFEGRPHLDKIRSIIEDRDYSGLEWYQNRPAQFASFMIRSWIRGSELYETVIADRGFIATDVPLLLTCAHYGKIRGMSDVMSVYRHNETGWTQKKHSKESIIRIAESELHYEVFGEEFKSQGESFYCLALVRAFFNTIVARDKSVDYDYIKLAWHKSKRKTIKSFFILAYKLTKKYLRV